MGFFSALRVFHLVQDFIALVDSRSSLLLARKARGVVEVADDAPVLEMQFRREINSIAMLLKRQAVPEVPRLQDDISAQIVRPASNISEAAPNTRSPLACSNRRSSYCGS
jgi:hypothetical protein